ncbi:TITAN-like protein isoform X2 [Cornus florida]|uniref:TITAN-like protein isoform X2 n=1 Tax=Cornus florida TaxID=4283 RepID=UPI0028993AAB|nr:TITAN-like protein isoform X2 [Cornus florida]
MDRLDALRISDVDLAKWEKKCKSLKSGAATEGSHGPNIGPSNGMRDIRYPIQNYLKSESCCEGSCGTRILALIFWCLYCDSCYMDGQHSLLYDGRTSSADGFSNGGVCQDGRTINGGSICQGLHITQISSTVREDGKGNVHSGAPPPWFNATEANPLNVGLKPGLGLSTVASPLSKPGKSQKLNPKRVGAAWAEKRKIELEMERRGVCIANNFDANWLPNFGRVWQSGSRKESRKEFEVEDKKPLKVETETETSIKIQPYISKRMRRDDGK